ncbi:hypothetical protein Tco_0474787 [Tanacetum coccineum]
MSEIPRTGDLSKVSMEENVTLGITRDSWKYAPWDDSNAMRNFVWQLNTAQASEVSSKEAKIKMEFFQHFRNRFDKPPDQNAHIDMLFPNSLSTDQQKDLECMVSKEEVKRAVWDCGTDKSPGPDGEKTTPVNFKVDLRKHNTIGSRDFLIYIGKYLVLVSNGEDGYKTALNHPSKGSILCNG